ncbi:nuclear transport factor 2 family protein [Nocardia sp. NPDC002869]|uniref:nuclear transport factor 2 family protein n=1 Tax=Nocardia sp. NPDC002869 TaxID=3161032 RepID=UPI00398CE3C3
MNDHEALRALKARYFRLMDTKEWAGFRALFRDDVVIDLSESGGEVITVPTSSSPSSPAGSATR